MSDHTPPNIALVTSNGWGLGHLSREIAVGLAIGDRAEVTIFTFSRGLPLVAQFGIKGEFCPGLTSPWIPPERWDAYVEARFEAFLSEVEPDVVLFDGVAPYVGVINALRRHPSVSAGWLRRGMWLSGPNDGQLHKSGSFDFVIEPGDIAAEADDGPTSALEAIRVPPVSLMEVVPTLGRTDSARALGLDPERSTLLFSLGSGQAGDSAEAKDAAIQQVLGHDDWQVAMLRSPLEADGPGAGNVGMAVDIAGVYPLSRYLSAFDAAISAAGYNSVHELLPARVPTLFVPKSASKTDNQFVRASHLASRGLALVARDSRTEEVRSQVEQLLGDARSELAVELAKLRDDEVMGGAKATATIVAGDPPSGIRTTGDDAWRQPGVKGLLNRTISPRAKARVLQTVGKAPARPRPQPLSLDPREGVTQVLVSEDPADVARSERQPVEHILAGASDSYRRARDEMIDVFYELVP